MEPTLTIPLKDFSEAIEAGIDNTGSWPMRSTAKEALRALAKVGTVFSNNFPGDDGSTEEFPGCPLSLIGQDQHFAARWKELFYSGFDNRIMDALGLSYSYKGERIEVVA